MLRPAAHMLLIFLFLALLSAYQAALSSYFLINPDFYQLDAYTWETPVFRSLLLGEYFASQPAPDYERIAALMIGHDYDLTKLKEKELDDGPGLKASISGRKPIEYKKLQNAYKMILQDVACFPVPLSLKEENTWTAYKDSWRLNEHEGCDLSGNGSSQGFYPVLSMTGGKVEKAEWTEEGWRLKIRAPSGASFYYICLCGGGEEWSAGDRVLPGTLLGYIGGSGFGRMEETAGDFNVQLHVGVSIPTDHYEELSVNPYWILRYSEQFTRLADY